MKTSFKLIIAAVIIGTTLLPSCKKYDDGPAISVFPKTMRLAGDWTVENYYENGTDKTADYRNGIKSETVHVEKGGSWTYSADLNFLNTTVNSNGTWAFANDKKDLTVTTTSTNPTSTDTWHILRLTNKEFWYTVASGNTTEEYHLKSK